MSSRYPSWGICARTDAARLERLAKRDLARTTWDVAAGNDGHVALFERLRWLDGWADGAVAGTTEPAGVLRAAEIPAAALGMDEGAP